MYVRYIINKMYTIVSVHFERLLGLFESQSHLFIHVLLQELYEVQIALQRRQERLDLHVRQPRRSKGIEKR